MQPTNVLFTVLCILHVIRGYTVQADDEPDKRAGMRMLRLGRSYHRGNRGFRMLRLGKRSDVDSGLRKLLYSMAEGKNFDSRQAPLPRYGRELDWATSEGLPVIDGEVYAPLRPAPRLGRFRRSVHNQRAVPMPRIGREEDEDSDDSKDVKYTDGRAVPIPRIGKDLVQFDDLPEVQRRAMSMLRLGKRRMAMLRLGKRFNKDVSRRAMSMLRLGRSGDKTESS